ncbi:hypothetical protein H5410_003048 [Solanum commersonii]|uniref:Uncharacterized protein n=1 Tax=Solanum commersonii TaxID=4109 RepID=A0A9J6B3Y2_SOLCO|nr:hypothetical protein H5410_003048 [Solanum commersonii]
MECEPPVGLFKSPDQGHLRCLQQMNKTHHESPSNSSYNSMNLRNNEVMHIAISERELDGIQNIISPDHEKLQHTKKSCDSISPIERTEEVNSGKIS